MGGSGFKAAKPLADLQTRSPSPSNSQASTWQHKDMQ